jgi:dienelactone hydrolase
VSVRRWIGILVGLSLGLAACGTPNVASTPAATTAGVRWTETAAPQGIDVPGAQWLKIEGAGGKSNNAQTAAVLRPQGSGVFPLVVWLHGDEGSAVFHVSAARRLAPAGFVVIVGCWQPTPAEPFVADGVSFPRIPCLQNFATANDSISALVEVGQQLSGVKKGAIGLYGVSSGGPQVLQYRDSRADIKAIVVDSSGRGPSRAVSPVLMLGGTADPFLSIEAQREYEKALRDSGSTVEAHYYEGGRHGVAVRGDFQEDAIKRIGDFYRRYLN